MKLIICVFFLIFVNFANAREARIVRINDKKMARIYVSPGRSTILSFSVKPTKVVLGSKGSFFIEYIENDLAVSAMSGGSRSNLFVYVQGRRFGFDLVGAKGSNDEIVIVRDQSDTSIPVKFKE